MTAWTAASKKRAGSRREACTVSLWFLLLSNLFVFQIGYFNRSIVTEPQDDERYLRPPLDYPRGTAVALPSVRLSKREDKKVDREGLYGGAGDRKHLGGFTDIDRFGVSPYVWKHMVSYFGIKSVLDVGCGRGISTLWFLLHGVDVQCVEGSHDAVEQSMLPDPSKQVVQHDFSRGPWWPSRTVDAIWCVEFLEHVGRNFHHNYLPAFRKAALIFATSSLWGGWHHVEVHDDTWWISKFEAYGFVYSRALTEMVKDVAGKERDANIPFFVTDETYVAQHILLSMKVFINPVVAALPEHAHLFAEHGCFQPGNETHRECDGDNESRLPKSFYPIEMTDDMDKAWDDAVRKHLGR